LFSAKSRHHGEGYARTSAYRSFIDGAEGASLEKPSNNNGCDIVFETKGQDTLNAEMMYFLRWIAIGKETSDLGI
jgi:hypothetical protein